MLAEDSSSGCGMYLQQHWLQSLGQTEACQSLGSMYAECRALNTVLCMHTLMISSTDWACLPWFFEAVVTCKHHTSSSIHSFIHCTVFFP